MEQNVIVLGVTKFDFISKDDGKRIIGAKVHYIDLDHQTTNSNHKGNVPVVANIDYAVADHFNEFPAYYTLHFNVRTGFNGRPSLSLVKATFLSSVSIST